MGSSYRRSRGFTLIELMVVVAIVIVVALVAMPSYQAQRQRAAVRGAGDQLLNFWNQARMEALKRNSMVKVGFRQSDSGATFCIGAATTTSSGDTTSCDCFSASPSSNVCDVGRFPANNAEWHNVTLSGVTLGGGTNLSDMEPVVIDPKRLFLAVPADDGTVTLTAPTGPRSYKLNLSVDRFGRGYVCQSSTSTDSMSAFTNTNRVCSP